MFFARLLAALKAAFPALIGHPALAFPKLEVLSFRAAHVPAGRVFHFMVKSDRNGSRATWNSALSRMRERLEASTWDQGGGEATLATVPGVALGAR